MLSQIETIYKLEQLKAVDGRLPDQVISFPGEGIDT